MFPSRRRSITTALLALALAAGAARLLLELTEPLRHPAGSAYDDLLLAFAGWVLLGCGAWALAIVVAAIVETTSSGRLRATAWVGCPPSLRHLLLTGLGVALVGAGPVHASASAVDQPPLPVPARPVGTAQSGGQVHPQTHLVVHPGDTLWHLAATRLRTSASPRDVATLVENLHRHNRKVIGPDPDLIRPGQHLAVPPRAHRS
jgi:hypothetical protein